MDSESYPDSKPNLGWAIASLVFGLLALVTSVVLIGALFGLVGLLAGFIHLVQRQRSNAMAWGGITFSILGVALSVALGVVYFRLTTAMIAGFGEFVDEVLKDIDNRASTFDEWEGVAAPDITVTTLDGETITLSELKGKRVFLHFWSTTSDGCLMLIPHLNALRESRAVNELIIVGISDEDSAKLQDFAKEHKLNYPVGQAGDLPAPFDKVTITPTTFVIDRNGIIQNVIVGYRDLSQLKEYATSADYSGAVKPAPEPAHSGLMESDDPRELTIVWTLEAPETQALAVGDWDADGKQDILVSGKDRTLRIINFNGQETAGVTVPEAFQMMELGRHPSGPRLLGCSHWGELVTVVDTSGKTVWTYPAADGLNGAHWGDLDGDGTDEMIVGMNGTSGLHAVSADGKALWQFTEIGNVWSQSVISASGQTEARVIATSEDGTIQVFNGKGLHLKTFSPFNDYFIRMAAVRESAEGPIQIIASHSRTVAMDDTGDIAWSSPADERDSDTRSGGFAWGDLDGDGTAEWAFVDITGELVAVTPQGEKFAALPNQRKTMHFVIVSNPSGDGLLVTMQAGTLRAYRCD